LENLPPIEVQGEFAMLAGQAKEKENKIKIN